MINILDVLRLRILSAYNEVMQLKRGEMPKPRMAILYPTYNCNHNCLGCDYSEQNKHPQQMNKEQFMMTLEDLVKLGVRAVEFCGGGEPSIYPYLAEGIRYLIKNKIVFGMLTNGTGLNDELIDLFISNGSYIRVSLDSGSKEIFDRYKRPAEQASFEKVISNINKLVDKKALNNSKLQVSYKYTIDKNNYSDVINAIHLADNLCVDSIQFKFIRNVESEIKDEAVISDIKRGIEMMKTSYTNVKILSDLDKSSISKPCWISPLQLTIDPLGEVYICCYYRHRMNEHRLGNMFSGSLKEIWYSKEHWDKMAHISVEDCNKYDCRFHFYNQVMEELALKDDSQLMTI